jgi:predicted peroxiredoxin
MEMRRLKNALCALAGSLFLTASAAQAEGADKLVTIVTAPEPQTQLMAMVLTMQSMQQKAKARVLLCGPAGDLALREAPASATAPQKPKDMSPQGLLKKIIEAGAQVEVCAIYLPNSGGTPDSLIEGIGVASPLDMAASLLADDTRIMSF